MSKPSCKAGKNIFVYIIYVINTLASIVAPRYKIFDDNAISIFVSIKKSDNNQIIKIWFGCHNDIMKI